MADISKSNLSKNFEVIASRCRNPVELRKDYYRLMHSGAELSMTVEEIRECILENLRPGDVVRDGEITYIFNDRKTAVSSEIFAAPLAAYIKGRYDREHYKHGSFSYPVVIIESLDQWVEVVLVASNPSKLGFEIEVVEFGLATKNQLPAVSANDFIKQMVK